MRTFIIADNQYITSIGIATFIKAELGATTILNAISMKDLQLKIRLYPNAIVIVDYTLFNFISMDQMLIVKASAPGTSWVLFSEELGEQFIRQITATDPTVSIVMKGDSREQLLESLLSADSDTAYLCETAELILKYGTARKSDEVKDKLTATERSILHEIALGKTTKDIAAQKNLSFHTVNLHRKNIFRKLEINNVHEAVKYALRAGIIDMTDYYI